MKRKTKTRILFYFVLVIIPVLFFILLESTLRIFDYGTDYSTFVEIKEISPGQYFLNPDLTKKYFTGTTAIPSVIPDPFDKNKSQNTIRIFVFGGSTTAGYPYSANASFPRQIKRKLELMYPDYKIEVINLGVSAVNTYFIYDILPDVLEHQPDLLIFYTGHNEYYGALGPASSEFVTSSPAVVRTILFLRELKTYQLVADIINSLSGMFSKEPVKTRGTLMREMIKEQEIPLNSEIFNNGFNQFKENMEDIISLCRKDSVPVIVGELISNLKQKPLGNSNRESLEIFKSAISLLEKAKLTEAIQKFEEAKDADPLRFRAPENFNKFLFDLKSEYDFELVEIKKEFNKISKDGIAGYDLFIDHLHPNLSAYGVMADLFYGSVQKILETRFDNSTKISVEAIDNYLKENFPFTRYDSTLAAIKIKILLNDFPFSNNNTYDPRDFELENYADTLALQTITTGLGWAAAHVKLFDHYFSAYRFQKAAEELFALMEDRPFYKSALKYAVPKLISAGLSREAKHILVRNYNRYPEGFTAKQLGIINLNEGKIKLANKLLEEAAGYLTNDAEIYFNLSRSYYALKEIEKAIVSMEKCLSINPEFHDAQKIYDRLKQLRN